MTNRKQDKFLITSIDDSLALFFGECIQDGKNLRATIWYIFPLTFGHHKLLELFLELFIWCSCIYIN